MPHKTVEGGSPRDTITEWDETIANGTISRLDELALAFDKPVVIELIGLGFLRATGNEELTSLLPSLSESEGPLFRLVLLGEPMSNKLVEAWS